VNQSSHRARLRRERGSVTPFVLLLCTGLAALVGLLAEGGLVLAAREATVAEAEQAARAGAAALAPSRVRAGSITALPSSAVAAAESVMSASGHPGTATDADGVVTVRVAPFTIRTPLLALAGIGSITVTATSSARSVAG
jgi:hypothetical protein